MSNSVPRHCEERSDEAIHRAASGEMDCFATLAMTSFRILATPQRPSNASSVPSEKSEGAGNAGCWPHPRGLACKGMCISRTQATTGQPEQPAFPAQWCYGLYVVS